MAKLRAGILGKTSGKVSNVVASTWKGINYIRERVVPANPNSIAQQRVRGVMRQLVLIGRSVKTTVIDTYWEKFVKGTAQSGWSKFIGTNQKIIQNDEDFSNFKLTSGDLEPLKSLSNLSAVDANKLEATWEKEVVSNGSGTDIPIGYVYVPERSYIYSQTSNPTREDEKIGFTVPDHASITGNIYLFVAVKKADGTIWSTGQASEGIV